MLTCTVHLTMDWRVKKVIRQLREPPTPDTRFTVNHLAATVNLSASRLRHLFKTETGMALKKCMVESRLQIAKRLLENTSLSVKEVAAKLGYFYESQFVRDFKRMYQVSPAQYRREHRTTTHC